MVRLPGITLILFMLPAFQIYAASVSIVDAWINESPPGMDLNAAYMVIENDTEKTIILEQVDSPDFERVEIHRSVIRDDQASMEMHKRLEIGANSVLRLTPGGYHLMLYKPSRKMLAGDFSSFNLHFSGALQIKVDAAVKKLTVEHLHHH